VNNTHASIKERVVALLLAVILPLFGYLIVGYYTNGNNTNQLETDIDTLVPMSAAWVFTYILMYVLSLAPICAISNISLLKRWVLNVGVMYMIAIPVWILLPVGVPRIHLEGDSFGVFLLGIIQFLDPPTNCFPSMHVAVATLSALVIRDVDKCIGSLILCAVPPIWYSTIAVGQHWAVDGIAGAVLAVTTYIMVSKGLPLSRQAFGRIERLYHFVWVLLFIVPVFLLWFIWKQ
jgi:membrane-associated phospholipid phosphatase